MGGRLSRCLYRTEPSSSALPLKSEEKKATTGYAGILTYRAHQSRRLNEFSCHTDLYESPEDVIEPPSVPVAGLPRFPIPCFDEELSIYQAEPSPLVPTGVVPVEGPRSESHVWRVSIANNTAFLASDGHLPYHTAIFVPEAALSQTTRSPLEIVIRQRISDDAKHHTDGEGQIGPMLCFTPHGSHFRRPLMALVTLTREMFHDDDSYDYTVVHSDTLEVPLEEWKDVSEYKPGDVSGLVFPQHQAAVLLLSHFSWFAIFRRYRRKTVRVEAYTMWKNDEPRVKITCLLRLDDAHMSDISEKYPHALVGELVDFRNMVISCSPAHIVICVRSGYDKHWHLETDRTEGIDRWIVWKGSIGVSTFWFTAKQSEAHKIFSCTIEAGQSPNPSVPLHINLMNEEPNSVTLQDSEAGASGGHVDEITADLPIVSNHPTPQQYNDMLTQGGDTSPKADNTHVVEILVHEPLQSQLVTTSSTPQNIHHEITQIFHVYGDLPPCYLGNYTSEEIRALQQNPVADMEPRLIDRLKELHALLREQMDPDGICSVLYSKNVITQEQYQKITKKDIPEQNEFILDVVRRQDNVELLQEILRQKCQGNIADMIQHHLEHTKPKELE